MADYSGAYESRTYTPEELAAQRATKAEYDRLEKERIAKYLDQAKKILDRGNIIGIMDLAELVIVANRPSKQEVWKALRELMHDNGKNGYGEVTHGKWGKTGG